MKKWLSALLSLVLVLGCAAGAQAETSFSGTVVAEKTVSVYAPFGASVESINVREGSLVKIGDPVATLHTTRVYAPVAGTIGAVFAQAGDTCDAVTERYTAIVYMEPVNRYKIAATTEKAYNSSTTKMIHIGEAVFLSCVADGTHTGTGIVTAIGDTDGAGNTAYTVEATSGTFYIGENINICRAADYASATRIGRGIVSQTKPIAVKGTGSVLTMHVQPGDVVDRGEVLFETVEGVLDGLYAPSNIVTSTVSGIVAKVSAETGAAVTKGGALISVYPQDNLQVQMAVPVIDLGSVSVGAKVVIEADIGGNEPMRYDGVVESISYIVSTEEKNKSVSAYVTFAADDSIRIGLPVTVYMTGETAEESHAAE